MRLAELLSETTRQGVHLSSDGEQLRIRGPKGALTPEMLAALTQLKPELLELLRTDPQPPGATSPNTPIAETMPVFDVAALTRLLEDDRQPLRDSVLGVLREFDADRARRLDRSAYRRQVFDWCRQLADQGFGAVAFPPEYGGRADTRAFLTVVETVCCHDFSLGVTFGVQFGLFGASIHRLGSRAHHEEYLAAAGSLELPGCLAVTETAHGSDLARLETVARFDRGRQQFVLDTPREEAGKDYIGNAAERAQMATVFAQLEIDSVSRGVHAFLVPIRNARGEARPGVRIEDCGEKVGLNGVDNGRLWFDGVRIPRENLLDRFAGVEADGGYTHSRPDGTPHFSTQLGVLLGPRLGLSLAVQSASKSALTIAVLYGSRRRQFGVADRPETPLLDYLTHQRRLMPRLAATYALHFALDRMAARYASIVDEQEDPRGLEGPIAGIKAYTTWHATDTVRSCREACGSQGYLAANQFAALGADTDVFPTFEGDNTVLMQVLARKLLTDHGRLEEYSWLDEASRDAGPEGTARSGIGGDEDAASLLDSGYQLRTMAWRERRLLSSLNARVRRRTEAGMEVHYAVIECQDHLLSVANAHVERLVLERFTEAVDRCREEPLRGVLAELRDLWALWRIETDRGWFLENGAITPARSEEIRRLVNRLCGRVRRNAVPLVRAFDIPDFCLRAPIALDDHCGPTRDPADGLVRTTPLRAATSDRER